MMTMLLAVSALVQAQLPASQYNALMTFYDEIGMCFDRLSRSTERQTQSQDALQVFANGFLRAIGVQQVPIHR